MATVMVDVPDGLRGLAAERGETVEVLARQVLAEWLAERLEEAEEVRIVRERWAEVEAGTVPLEDWEDVKAELDALPDPDAS